MKHEIRTCDICEKQVHGGEFYTVKIRSSMFVNYHNFDQFFADRKSFDICENCRHLFFMFVNDMKKPKKDVIELGTEYNTKDYTITITTNSSEREVDESHSKILEREQTFKVERVEVDE